MVIALRRVLASTFVAVALSSAPAFAAPGGSGAASNAQEQFADAQKRFDAKDYEGALELFRKSLESSGSPNARLYVARCLKQLGRLTEAYEEMSATVREATARAQSESKYVPTRDAAAAELALLEPKIGKLVVAIADAPAGIEVRLAGAAMANDRIGTPVAVEPGKVHVEAKAADGKSLARDVQVGAGETKTVTLSFAAPAAQGPGPPPDNAPRATEAHGGGVRTAGFVIAGLGAAGIVVFAVTGSMSNAKFDALKNDCGGARCTDPTYADRVDEGKRLDLIANVSLIAGGVALATGLVLIAVGGPKRSPTTAITFRPGGAGLAARF